MILRLVFFPLVVLFRLLLAPLRALRRARAAPKGALVEITIKGRVREGPARPRRMWPPRLLLARPPRPELRLHVLRKVIDEALADPRVAGVLVTIEGIEAGWATIEAMREELLRVRNGGKRLCAWIPSAAGNRELFVASAAQTIVAAPTADIALTGIKAEGHYARSALDKIGIDVELHARKEFKSAGDRAARDGRSAPDRLQTEVIVDGVDAALFAAIMEGRGLSREALQAILDDGPTHARHTKLVDHVAQDDELPTLLGATIVPASSWYARRRSGRDARPLFARPVVGVVQVHGGISSSSTPIAGAMGPVALADRVIADLRAAERDPRVLAVIVDVDSPGGTVTASDAIGAAVRRLAQKKPVIARMGDVAASGGYWVACEARAIVARPLTLTGSIGVVALRPIAERLVARIGIARDVVARGRFADMDALSRAPREDETAVFSREIDRHYEAFVTHVATARKRDFAAIEEVARGRVWLGKDALERGLVDRLGGFELAFELAREAAGKAVDPDPRLVVGRVPSRRDPSPESKRSLAFVLSLLPADLRAELLPFIAAIESRARIALVAAPPSI